MIRSLDRPFEEILLCLMLAVSARVSCSSMYCRHLLRFPGLHRGGGRIIRLVTYLGMAAFRQGSHLAFHFSISPDARSFQKWDWPASRFGCFCFEPDLFSCFNLG
jgi:hypothetical protein